MQEVVILLSILITQIGVILTSKADHLFDAFGILSPELVQFITIPFSCTILDYSLIRDRAVSAAP